MFRFFAIFIALTVALFAAELTPPGKRFVVDPWTQQLAQVVAAVMQVIDSNVIAAGRTLLDRRSGQGVSIEAGCNGIEAIILIIAAMVAFRAPWKHRIVGIVVGAAAVQLLNVVRIISLYYLAAHYPSAFEWTHLYLWQVLIMVDVLIVWLAWLRWISRRPGVHEAA
jgi:exosortase H (IPTLxxWG-CTERM-specific)